MLFRLAVVLAACLALVFLSLLTTFGQRVAIGLASYFVTSKDFTVSVGRLDGSLLDRGRIAQVRVGDRKGTWLDIQNIRFNWSVLSLLRGEIDVEDLHFESVRVVRKPEPSQQPGPTSNGALPLLPIALKKLQVEQLILGQALVGRGARFRIRASAKLQDYRQGLSAELSATRLDQPGARLTAHLKFSAPSRDLDIQVSASEPAGGLVAALLQLPDRPAMSMNFSGEGSLDAWRAAWSVSASERPFIAGRTFIDRMSDRHRLALDFTGYLQAIVPTALADMMSGKTTGSLIGHFTGLDRFDASQFLLANDALRIRGSGGFAPATSYGYGSLSARIARDDNRPVGFVVSNGERFQVRSFDLNLAIPDVQTAREVSMDVAIEDLTHRLGAVSKLRLSSRLNQTHPVGSNVLSEGRVNLQAQADGFTSELKGLEEAVGARNRLDLTGTLKPGGLTINSFRLGNRQARLVGSGDLSLSELAGNATLLIDDLSRLSTIFRQPVAGRLNATVSTTVDVNESSLALRFEGNANRLDLGDNVIGRLLGRSVKVAGAVSRSGSQEIKLENFHAVGTNVTIATSGRYAKNNIALDLTTKALDLSAIRAGLTGAGELVARLNGAPDSLVSDIRFTTQSAKWQGHDVDGLVLSFSGKGPVTSHAGRLNLDGRVGPQKLVGKANLEIGTRGNLTAQDLELAIGRNKLTGSVRGDSVASPSGNLVLNAANLSDLGVFIGQEISGRLAAVIEMPERRSEPTVRIRIDAPDARLGGISIKALKGSAEFKNYLAGVNGSAALTLSQLSSEHFKVRNLSLKLQDDGQRMILAGSARLNDADVALQGSLKQHSEAIDVILTKAGLNRGALDVRLDGPARIVLKEEQVLINRLRLAAGKGRAELQGSANSNTLNLEARLSQVPAKIANTLVPELGLDGVISGQANIRGQPSKPIVTANASWENAVARALRKNHLPPVNVKLDGDYRDGTASARISVKGPQSLSLSMHGNARIKNGQGIDFRVQGDIPLAFGNAALSARATELSGRAKVSGRITGTSDSPKLNAQINIPNASINDPVSGVKLEPVVGRLVLTERQLTIQSLKAHSDLGGSALLSGGLSTDAGKVRADLDLQLSRFRFDDRQLLAGEVDGEIAAVGPLDAIAVTGSIYIRRMDITVPAAVPRSLAALDVQHINAPDRLRKLTKPETTESSGSSPIRAKLNLRIKAANRIFVKGRGVGAQLGGGMKVLGSSSSPTIEGGFEMERGRLDIFGRRLDFRHGRILFDGTADPQLDMEAGTAIDDVSITATITGPASKPAFKFSSAPELPEDEIISRLLFNKALVGLSPLQLVQLASEVDKIGGLSSGPGILDQLKSSVGIDVLDVSTDKAGAATVSAGRYVTDKTYVGVKQGASANSSRVVIDHEFTKNLRARGEVGANGNSKLGIGLGWDY